MQPLLKNPVFLLISLLTIASAFIIGVLVGSQFLKEELPPTFINETPGIPYDGTGSMPQPPEDPIANPTSNGCVVGGCSGQLCTDDSPDSPATSTCEWREEYACYQKFGTCERQKDGHCGWTTNPEMDQCLQIANDAIYFEDQSTPLESE